MAELEKEFKEKFSGCVYRCDDLFGGVEYGLQEESIAENLNLDLHKPLSQNISEELELHQMDLLGDNNEETKAEIIMQNLQKSPQQIEESKEESTFMDSRSKRTGDDLSDIVRLVKMAGFWTFDMLILEILKMNASQFKQTIPECIKSLEGVSDE